MKHRLEIKVIKGHGMEPETFDIPIEHSSATKLNLFVFRGSTSMSEKGISDLVEISQRLTKTPCTALILGEEDKFEVYEVEIPTRYQREPII
jgi:hypothetical protein